MTNNIVAVLKFKYPGKQWTVRGASLAEWNEVTPAPTQQDLDTADAELTTSLTGKTNALNAVFGLVNSRLGISVASVEELKAKRSAIYDAIDAKEDQALNGPGAVEGKINQLRQVWNVRNKIESILS